MININFLLSLFFPEERDRKISECHLFWGPKPFNLGKGSVIQADNPVGFSPLAAKLSAEIRKSFSPPI